MGLALMGELISNQRHLKLKENRESNLITTAAILEVQEASKSANCIG